MDEEYWECVICHDEWSGFGNNPWPLADEGRCCDDCNVEVIVARLRNMREVNDAKANRS